MARRFQRKPVLILCALIAVVGLLVAGCGGQKQQDQNASSKPLTERFKGSTIYVSDMAGYENNVKVKQLVPEFEQKYGIKVVIDEVPYSEVVAKHMSMLTTGGSEYDLVNIDSIFLPQYAPFLTPLDDFKNTDLWDDSQVVKDDFVESTIAQSSYQDKWYMFPQMYVFPIMSYRADLLKEAGLVDADGNAKPPKNIDEWFEYAKKLTKNGVYGETLQLLPSAAFDLHVMTLILAQGGTMLDDELKPCINTPEGIKALTMMQKLYTGGYTPPGGTDYELGEGAAVHKQGLTAMSHNWAIVTPWLEDPKESKVAGKLIYDFFPQDKPGLRFERGGTMGLGINKASKNKEAAFLFAQWAASKETQLKVASIGTKGARGDGSPPRKSVLYNDEYKNEYKHYDLLRKAIEGKQDWPVPTIPEWFQIELECGRIAQATAIGKTTPEEGAKQMDEAIYNVLNSRGYYDTQGKKYPVEVTGNYNHYVKK